MVEAERDLNGLPREKLTEVLESFRDPEVFNAVTGPWKSRIAWQGGMRARAYMRNHQVDMDEPGDLTATDVAASAHEQLLSAVGSCMTVGFVVNATKQGVRIHDLEVAVEGYFDNIRKWAGVEDEGNPRLWPHFGQVLRPRRCRRGHTAGNLAAGGGRFPRHPVGSQRHVGLDRLRNGWLVGNFPRRTRSNAKRRAGALMPL